MNQNKSAFCVVVWRWPKNSTAEFGYIDRIEGPFKFRRLATARQRELNKKPLCHANVFTIRRTA